MQRNVKIFGNDMSPPQGRHFLKIIGKALILIFATLKRFLPCNAIGIMFKLGKIIGSLVELGPYQVGWSISVGIKTKVCHIHRAGSEFLSMSWHKVPCKISLRLDDIFPSRKAVEVSTIYSIGFSWINCWEEGMF